MFLWTGVCTDFGVWTAIKPNRAIAKFLNSRLADETDFASLFSRSPSNFLEQNFPPFFPCKILHGTLLSPLSKPSFPSLPLSTSFIHLLFTHFRQLPPPRHRWTTVWSFYEANETSRSLRASFLLPNFLKETILIQLWRCIKLSVFASFAGFSWPVFLFFSVCLLGCGIFSWHRLYYLYTAKPLHLWDFKNAAMLNKLNCCCCCGGLHCYSHASDERLCNEMKI